MVETATLTTSELIARWGLLLGLVIWLGPLLHVAMAKDPFGLRKKRLREEAARRAKAEAGAKAAADDALQSQAGATA